MKKILTIFLALLVLTGCAANESPPSSAGTNTPGTPAYLYDEDILEIGERFFLTQMNQIYLNRENYLGRTIRYEGMFYTISWEDYTYHLVIRHTFGCCGNDGMAGFDVALNGIEPFPDNTWVEVTGVLSEFEFSEWYNMLYVDVATIVEMPERGSEFVEN